MVLLSFQMLEALKFPWSKCGRNVPNSFFPLKYQCMDSELIGPSVGICFLLMAKLNSSHKTLVLYTIHT